MKFVDITEAQVKQLGVEEAVNKKLGKEVGVSYVETVKNVFQRNMVRVWFNEAPRG